MAAAAFTATATTKNFFSRRDRSFFKGLGDESIDRVGDSLKNVLRFVEGLNRGMVVRFRAQLLETLNLSFIQFAA